MTQTQPIRNRRIRRDFKRLLQIITDDKPVDYAEVEAIASRNGLYFDDGGNVKEAQEV